MNLKGGKYLGEGTYGCVFFPSIQCHDKQKQKDIFKTGVSKVFRQKSDMNEELKETKKIDKMDKHGLYTNKALGNCEININNFTTEDKKSCKKIKNSPFYHQIVYQHKGIDLNKFMNKSFTLPQTYNYILNLLKGIQLLTQHRYVHLDLKPENILISDSNKALLIDFGLGRTFNDLYNMNKSDYILNYSYPWYPPEFRLFFELHAPNLNYIVQDFIEYNQNKFYRRFDEKNIKKESMDFISELTKVNIFNGSKVDEIKISAYFVKNFAAKADVFAIGMVMSYIKIFAKPNELHDNLFEEIIDKAIRINPFKRANIGELINDLEVLIKNTSADDLKQNIQASNPPKPNNVNLNQNNNNIKTSSSQNTRVKECMKHKKPELVAMVDKYNLPKNLKQLNKKPLCEKLIQHIEKEKNVQAHPLTSTKDDVTFENCMKYFTLNELKQEVTKNNLPLRLKQMHKPELCKELLPYLKNKSNQKTIKRGPKPNKK